VRRLLTESSDLLTRSMGFNPGRRHKIYLTSIGRKKRYDTKD
jgi:hypothetical protein